MKALLMILALVGCVTPPPPPAQDLAYVKTIHGCDSDPDFGAYWCAATLNDDRLVLLDSWDIKEGDRVLCVLRNNQHVCSLHTSVE